MDADAATRGIQLEPELRHVLLFYTTGDIIASVIPPHVPYADRFGVWSQTKEMERLRGVLADSWQPYLAGTATFERALDVVVQKSRR